MTNSDSLTLSCMHTVYTVHGRGLLRPSAIHIAFPSTANGTNGSCQHVHYWVLLNFSNKLKSFVSFRDVKNLRARLFIWPLQICPRDQQAKEDGESRDFIPIRGIETSSCLLTGRVQLHSVPSSVTKTHFHVWSPGILLRTVAREEQGSA